MGVRVYGHWTQKPFDVFFDSFGDARIQAAAARGLNEHIRLQERQSVRIVGAQTKFGSGRVAGVTRSIKAAPSPVMTAEVQVRDAPTKSGENTSRSWHQGMKGGAKVGDWKPRTLKGTFTVAKYGGDVFHRTSKKRFPIKRAWGPILPRELQRRDMPNLPAAERLVAQDLLSRVMRHIAMAI